MKNNTRSSSSLPASCSIYIVGGAVRDKLLGHPIQDRDWVVVGATLEDMLEQGFKAVGKDFPVFLHPKTGEEYALARTERKTGPGYKGFAFEAGRGVTLEDDLLRRDLTINAMAQDEQGNLIDPYGGQRDLQARIFRHVSLAFAEDPVRILRLARFAARLPDFSLAPETLALMKQMVEAGEVDHLVPERVWQEIARGLMCERPSRMIDVLRECGALKRLLPELDALFGVPQPAQWHPEIDTGLHTKLVIDMAAQRNEPLPVRVACLMHDLGKGATPPENWPSHHGHEWHGMHLAQAVCDRLRVSADCRDLAMMVARDHTLIHHAEELSAADIVKLLEKVDALRRPERFQQLLASCLCDARGRTGLEHRPYPSIDRLETAYAAYANVNAGVIAQQAQDKMQIPHMIHHARVLAVQAALSENI